jgi:riboflavin kinase/FMN adenylyltransferase
MHIIHSLDEQISIERPLAMTIGNFDGVHLGHQAILAKLREKAARDNGETVVISFTNHPIEILQPGTIVPRLCTLEYKIKLMEEQGIDHLMLLRFTVEFSQQTPEKFLEKVQKWHPIRYLLLGEDAVLGKDRQGNSARIQDLSKQLGFEVEYLNKLSIQGESISSRKVRQIITAGNLGLASQLLGRKYSIYSPIIEIDHNVVSMDTTGLCLPPPGDYAIKFKVNGNICHGQVKISPTGVLTVTPVGLNEDLAVGTFVEVIF